MFSGRAQQDLQEGGWSIHNNGFLSNHRRMKPESSSGSFSHRLQCDGYKSNGFIRNNPAKTPQMIYSSDLPFDQEVIAELVEGPLDFENNDGELSFFVRMKEFPDDSYYHMQRALDRYVTTKSPDVNVPKDGDCVIAARQGVGYRGRVVHSDDGYHLYLFDHGVARLVKEMWLINNSKDHATKLFHLSGAVVECQLAGVQFKDSSSKEKVRQVLDALRERPNVTIRLTRVGFNGKVNLVKMLVQYDSVQPSISDFGLAIIEHDFGVYAPSTKKPTTYNRSELLQLRDLADVGKDLSVGLHRMNIHKDDMPPETTKHH
ncbi:unnamed protein product, partial [Mesorhabditis belari]|uniref:Tudor domain-containing protein n=1 Tax=Mesorhabditis belari TaxID=2138241 RepID=A0AAF3FBW9_9BILA